MRAMQHLADLLATIPLPEPVAAPATEGPPGATASADPGALLADGSVCGTDLVHDLGADLPAGHLHVWGGPAGAGKTAFLLCLLQEAAASGRRVVYATYDLPAETLALRLLAMTAGVPWRALPDPGGTPGAGAAGRVSAGRVSAGSAFSAQVPLEGHDLLRARAARDVLSRLPFDILPARGLGVASLEDRLVRMPFRADVLAVDYMQAVVGEPDAEPGTVLRALSTMAERLYVAVICTTRMATARSRGTEADDEAAGLGDPDLRASEFEALGSERGGAPERWGWIAPAAESAGGRRQAEVLHNRYGETPAVPLSFDEPTGRFDRL